MRLAKSPSTLLLVVAAAAILIIGYGIGSTRAEGTFTSLLQETRLPVLYWERGIETARVLNQAGVTGIAVPPAAAPEWRGAGFRVVSVSSQDLGRREKLLVPRMAGRVDVASATRRPWIDLNGWRVVRKPSGKYMYDLVEKGGGQASLAIAEAFAYQADALLKIDPADLEAAGRMLAFLRTLPGAAQSPIADIGFIDDGSAASSEVMNLLTRRNLLFRLVSAPGSQFRVNIKLGSNDYPRGEASDPNAFALKVRRQLGDENRTLRLYGTELVIARLTGDAVHSQLHLLNYSGREVEGLRVRLKGKYSRPKLKAFGIDQAEIEDFVVSEGTSEFTLPRLSVYALIDLPASN